ASVDADARELGWPELSRSPTEVRTEALSTPLGAVILHARPEFRPLERCGERLVLAGIEILDHRVLHRAGVNDGVVRRRWGVAQRLRRHRAPPPVSARHLAEHPPGLPLATSFVEPVLEHVPRDPSRVGHDVGWLFIRLWPDGDLCGDA